MCYLEIRQRANVFAQWMIVASGIAIALPTFWIGLTEGLFLIAWLIGGDYSNKWRRIWNNPVARISLILAIFGIVSMAWSPVNFVAAFDGLGHYRELLLIPLMLSLMDDLRWAMRTLYGFIAGLGFALFWSYLQWFGWVPLYAGIGHYGGFSGHIGFSTMLAFLVVASFWLALYQKEYRWLWITLGLLALFNLFIINTGRTGQLILFALIPLALFRILRWRGFILAGGLMAVLAVGLYTLAPTFNDRVQAAISDLNQYQAGNSNTSWGLRLEFWRNTLALAKTHPLMGGGTGSMPHEYAQLAEIKGLSGEHVADNPHNEYLMILTQWGLVGLLLFIGLLWIQWRTSTQLSPLERQLAEALVLTMAIGCLFNSFLLDNLEGHFYALLTIALWWNVRSKSVHSSS
ncbi:MAG: O-antigen ligase family protein [Halothiobacillaceae bacterium]